MPGNARRARSRFARLSSQAADRNLLLGRPRREVVDTLSAWPHRVSRCSLLLGIATAVFSLVPQVVSMEKTVWMANNIEPYRQDDSVDFNHYSAPALLWLSGIDKPRGMKRAKIGQICSALLIGRQRSLIAYESTSRTDHRLSASVSPSRASGSPLGSGVTKPPHEAYQKQ